MTKDSFEGHLNMHAGIKSVACRYCDARYQNRSNCLAHEKRVHKDIYTKQRKSLGGVRVAARVVEQDREQEREQEQEQEREKEWEKERGQEKEM